MVHCVQGFEWSICRGCMKYLLMSFILITLHKLSTRLMPVTIWHSMHCGCASIKHQGRSGFGDLIMIIFVAKYFNT